MHGYDLGAVFYEDVPEAPDYFNISYTSTSYNLAIRWKNPSVTVHGTPLDTLSNAWIYRNGLLVAQVNNISNFQDTLEYIDVIPGDGTYRYEICVIDISGKMGRMLYTAPKYYDDTYYVSIEGDLNTNVPDDIYLSQNYPNPFNPTTTIDFFIPERSTIELNIYNSRGQLIRTLANGEYDIGNYSEVWNGRDNYGNQVSSGVYFYELKSSTNIKKTKKMLFIK